MCEGFPNKVDHRVLEGVESCWKWQRLPKSDVMINNNMYGDEYTNWYEVGEEDAPSPVPPHLLPEAQTVPYLALISWAMAGITLMSICMIICCPVEKIMKLQRAIFERVERMYRAIKNRLTYHRAEVNIPERQVGQSQTEFVNIVTSPVV